MMDVDQPVTSTTGDEQAELDSESRNKKVTDKSPAMIERENDDLPPLLISDSEEEDPSNALDEENQTDEISGISPIETTAVVKANDTCADTGTETTTCSSTLVTQEETSAVPAAVDEADISVVDNIDLTGASSAEDSGVNEASSERTTLSVVKPPTLTKPSSEMTAQELLESLLEAQEEAFASQNASLNAEKELAEGTLHSTDADTIADAEKTTKSTVDGTQSEVVKEAINLDADEPVEDCVQMDTLAVDDECLLEEMANVQEKQQEMDIDEHRTGSNNTECSDDSSGADRNSNETEQANALNCHDNEDDMLECIEPPRKKARSMVSVTESDSKAGSIESSFRSIENDIVQNEKPSEEITKKTDALCSRKEQLDLPAQTNKDLSPVVDPKPAPVSLEGKSQSNMTGSSDTTIDSSDLLNGDPQKKECIAVGAQKNVQTVESSVIPDVLVIDDDEDETDVNSIKVQDTEDKKIDEPQNNNSQMDQNSDTTVKSLVDDSKPPAAEENMETKPMAMEFLRRFSKPITQMTRSDLEQLILQKLSEAIVHQSENAELRRIVKRQSAKLQGYERTIVDMSSHYEGLKLVAERAVDDMKKRSTCFVAPVKITRAVGLQVSRPAIEMAPSYKGSNFSRMVPEKRKNPPATATVSTNGAIENRAQTKPSELANKITQQPSGGQENALTPMNRSQLSNNVSPIVTARITPNNSATANGMIRTLNSQVGKHNNGAITTSGHITSGNTVKSAAVPTNDGPGVPIANTSTFASASQKTGTDRNSIAGGIDNPVRKKFHKFTPKRPPLSPYQQAQQEKQVRQQQELLVQQIHEQSQQAQRKAQISVRTDLPLTENSATRSASDIAARQRSITQQGRLLNANVQMPVSQSYQNVPIGGTRATAAMTNSATVQLSEIKSNTQPTTPVAPTVNDSLIDLTDEDDTTGKGSSLVSSMQQKRMKTSHSGSFASTLPISTNPSMQGSSNQFVRIQPKTSTINGSAIVPAAASSTSVGGINQFNNVLVRTPPNVNRSSNGLPPLRHPNGSSNLPRLQAAPTDATRKRVVIKPVLAPLPHPGPQPSDPTWKVSPPQPSICVNNVQAGIVISWTMPTLTDLHADIETYQIYAYQELSSATSPEQWRHVGDVKALLLPMAVTLTQFHEGQRYYFAVRAIDVHKRVGRFCEPRTWNDTNVSNI
uniref:Fibronectin type-III domain-containing protein n=1 Tax=Anopheles funestus TaxID=62324 RepID=A0A182RTR9_ANOFN